MNLNFHSKRCLNARWTADQPLFRPPPFMFMAWRRKNQQPLSIQVPCIQFSNCNQSFDPRDCGLCQTFEWSVSTCMRQHQHFRSTKREPCVSSAASARKCFFPCIITNSLHESRDDYAGWVDLPRGFSFSMDQAPLLCIHVFKGLSMANKHF